MTQSIPTTQQLYFMLFCRGPLGHCLGDIVAVSQSAAGQCEALTAMSGTEERIDIPELVQVARDLPTGSCRIQSRSDLSLSLSWAYDGTGFAQIMAGKLGAGDRSLDASTAYVSRLAEIGNAHLMLVDDAVRAARDEPSWEFGLPANSRRLFAMPWMLGFGDEYDDALNALSGDAEEVTELRYGARGLRRFRFTPTPFGQASHEALDRLTTKHPSIFCKASTSAGFAKTVEPDVGELAQMPLPQGEYRLGSTTVYSLDRFTWLTSHALMKPLADGERVLAVIPSTWCQKFGVDPGEMVVVRSRAAALFEQRLVEADERLNGCQVVTVADVVQAFGNALGPLVSPQIVKLATSMFQSQATRNEVRGS